MFRKFVLLLSTLAATQAFADTVTFLGTNSSGNAVFMINNSHPTDVSYYKITAGGSTIGYGVLSPGNHIVEHIPLSAGQVVSLEDDTSALRATVTLNDVSTSFSIQSNSTDDVGTIQGSLISDAIKETATAQTDNSTAISKNSKRIDENEVGIAEAMALGVMQMDLSYSGLQTSLGAANFNGSQGFAFMAGKAINESAFVSFSATSTGNYAGGITIKW